MARGRFLLGLLSGAVLTGAVGAGGLYAFGGVIGPMLIGAPAIPKPPPVAASQASREMLADAAARVAADDRQDFADAERGYIATLADPLIRNDKGEVVFDLSSYDFLKNPAPDTANPSLWRHAQIITKHGLFKVADGIRQVRGFDVSTVSFIDAGAGWIVVDPLLSEEAAAAARQMDHQACTLQEAVAMFRTEPPRQVARSARLQRVG